MLRRSGVNYRSLTKLKRKFRVAPHLGRKGGATNRGNRSTNALRQPVPFGVGSKMKTGHHSNYVPSTSILLIVVGLGMLFVGPRLILPQGTFSQDKAKEIARTLVGETPDHVATYSSPQDRANYLAFSAPKKDSFTAHLWLYRESGGSFELLWQKDIQIRSPFDFSFLPGEIGPSIRIQEDSCGSDACTYVLSVYSVQRKTLFSISYLEDRDATPEPVVEEHSDEAPDPEVRAWLETWARELRIYPKKTNPSSLDNPASMEVAWVNDNGHRTSGVVKLRYYQELPPNYDTGFFLYGLPHHLNTSDVARDGRFTWNAFFKSGVVGYDSESRRYFMIYLPADRSSWIRKLAVRGTFVYMSNDCNYKVDYPVQDADCTWTLRYNKVTHALEEGQFAVIAKPHHEEARAPLVGHEFWTTTKDKQFRPGHFSPSIESASRLEFALLEGQGWTCDVEATDVYGCYSGAGSIMVITSNQGSQTLQVVVFGTAGQTEQVAATLFKLALLLVGRPAWNEAVKSGMAKLKTAYDSAPPFFKQGDLYHYDREFCLHFIVMNRDLFEMIMKAMVIEAGIPWEKQSLPDTKYWVLSIQPRLNHDR